MVRSRAVRMVRVMVRRLSREGRQVTNTNRQNSPVYRLKEPHLVAFGRLRAEINNGGFSQYFFNSSGDSAPDALAAAGAMGATEVAALLGRAMALLGDPYPLARASRQQRLEELEDMAEEPFETG